jgi:hypothetical protein
MKKNVIVTTCMIALTLCLPSSNLTAEEPNLVRSMTQQEAETSAQETARTYGFSATLADSAKNAASAYPSIMESMFFSSSTKCSARRISLELMGKLIYCH